MTRLLLAALVVCGCAITAPAHACKYSVRDVGFVNMKNADYSLIFLAGDQYDAAFRSSLEKIARQELAGSNVGFTMIDLVKTPDPKIVKLLKNSPGLWLVGPNDRATELELPTIANTLNADRLTPNLRNLANSPFARQLAEQLPNAFAVTVFVDGDDPAENQRARLEVERVTEQIRQVMGRLEKPAKGPPLILSLDAQQRENERSLLWALGVEETKRPNAAIVFGRFRRGAKLFTGDQIDAAKMFSPLAALGFSCECNLDRDTLFGPTLPHRWTDDNRKRTSAANGFEPDDPQVRAEVNAILAKKPLIEAGELSVTFEELMLGLKETPLDESDPAPPASPTPAKEVAPPNRVWEVTIEEPLVRRYRYEMLVGSVVIVGFAGWRWRRSR